MSININITFLIDLSSLNVSNINQVKFILGGLKKNEEAVLFNFSNSKFAKWVFSKELTKNIMTSKEGLRENLKRIRGSYLLVIRPDTILHTGNIDRCIKYLKRKRSVDGVLLNTAKISYFPKRFSIIYKLLYDFSIDSVKGGSKEINIQNFIMRKDCIDRMKIKNGKTVVAGGGLNTSFFTGVSIISNKTGTLNHFVFYCLDCLFGLLGCRGIFEVFNAGRAWITEVQRKNDSKFLIREDYRLKTKIILGSAANYQRGFISTDIDFLNIVKKKNWKQLFNEGSIDNLLAEHVFEHLSDKEVKRTFGLCFKYLKKGGKLRLAVPDKNRKDANYVKLVKPPMDSHKSYFNVEELTETLEGVGFGVYPLEYFDSNNKFHKLKWNILDGKLKRSLKFDKQRSFRTREGGVHYTSLIIDAIKPLN